jgi:AraC-like DNA-binding protein
LYDRIILYMNTKESQPEREIIEFKTIDLQSIVELGRYHYTNVNDKLNLHTHDGCMEIVYIEKGIQKYWVNDQYFTSKGGDIFITFPDELHGTYEYPEEKGNIYWLIVNTNPKNQGIAHLNNSFSQQLLEALLNIETRSFKGNVAMKSYLARIFTLHQNKNRPLQIIEIGNLIVLFLTEVIKASELSGNQPDIISQTINSSIIHIKKNIHEPIHIEHLAAMSNLSVSHFKYRFKKETGYTPGDYILRCRIDEAKNLLTKSNFKIAEIAYQLGFNNPSYFATIFKRYVGQTPTAYLTQISLSIPPKN